MPTEHDKIVRDLQIMNMPLNKLLYCCCILPTPLWGAWSGINFSIGDESTPIISNNNELTLTPFDLKLSIEDKTPTGLHIAASMAKSGVKVKGASTNIDTATNTLGLSLSLPFQFNDFIGITSRLSFAKSTAISEDDTQGELDYLTKKISLGLSLKWKNWRVIPTMNAFSIKGNFKHPNDTTAFNFTEKQAVYTSLSIDYFSKHNSFIRFFVTEHSDSTFRISFITKY